MKTTQNHKEVTDYETLEALFNQAPTIDCFMFSLWMFWCESVTVNSREFQQVLSNPKVNKWFLLELGKEEKECATLLLKYDNVNQKDKNRLYIKCVYKLFSRFPMALLEVAKKRMEKQKTTKVSGLRIEFSILNQN
jgi:hypothetical protein